MEKQTLKRFVVILCIAILVEECHMHEVSLPNKLLANIENDKSNILNDIEDEFDNFGVEPDVHESHTLFENDELTFEEDKYDLELKAIAQDYEISRKNKRALGAVVLIFTMTVVSGIVGSVGLLCPSILEKAKEVERAKKEISTERREINSDWGVVDSKTRFLQRLASDSEILKRSIEKMDELKRDIITLVEPHALQEISKLHSELKERIQQANNATLPGIEKAARAEYDNFIRAMIVGGVLGAALMKTVYMLFHPDKYSTSLFRVTNNAQHANGAKNLIKSKITFGNIAYGALAGLSIVLAALSLALTLKACNTIETTLNNVREKQIEALKNFTDIRNKMTLLNGYVDTNYTMVWKDMASKEFMSFVSEAIDAANNSEVITNKTKQSIKDMMEFRKEFPKTKNNFGRVAYVKVEDLTGKLINGFLDGNHQLNCYRKKMKIVKVISDRCASGESSFEELWSMAVRMDKENLKDCLVDHKYVSKEGMQKIINKIMNKKNKQEICVRNNNIKKLIICQAYLKDENNMLSKVNGLTQNDVDFFTSTCELPPVDENLRIQLCRKKENQNTNATTVFGMYSKYNLTSLKETWNNCNFTKAQTKFICDSKQNGVQLKIIAKSLSNYNIDIVTEVYASCMLKISNAAKIVICIAHKQNNTRLIELQERRYGKENVQNTIKNKCQK